MTEYYLRFKECEIDEIKSIYETIHIPDDAIALEVEYEHDIEPGTNIKKAHIRYLEPVN